MNKKTTPLLKLAAAVMLTALLCVATAIPAFAAAGDPITGTEESPARAATTKLLEMPVGTTTPDATFTFDFAKKNLDGNEGAEALAGMPDIASRSVSFSAADAGTVSGGVKSVAKETGGIFDSVDWPHAGIYVYTVTERADTYGIENSFQEQLRYSAASYEIAVYVMDGENSRYVSAIAASITVKDAANEGSDLGDKVDPTPGGNPDVDGDYSKMIFTNTYLKNTGGTDPDDTVLAVSKEVTGNFANQSKYFQFNVRVNNPATVTNAATVYKAYVLDGDGAVVTDTANAATEYIRTDPVNGAYIEFTTAVEQTVHLKHGQRLSFTDLPVGARFAVTEAATVGYTPSYVLTVNGGAGSAVNGTDNTALGFTNQYIGEAANGAAFTNTNRDITPTGIRADHLPYIVLIGVVVFGVMVFIAVKLRRNRRHSGNY